MFACNKHNSMAVWVATVVLVGPAGTLAQPTQETLFVGNNVSGTVSVFTVNEDGTLTEIAASPFPAGNNPQAVALTGDGRLLAVVNATQATLEELRVFSVGPQGELTEVAGSPYFVSDGPLGMDISTVHEVCLVPQAADDQISSFIVLKQGLQEAVGSPFATSNFPVEVDTTPGGAYAYVSHLFPAQVSGYAIDPDTGQLNSVPGSPFGTSNAANEVVVSPDGLHVYTANGTDNTVSGWSINADDGSLTPIPGSPFPSGGSSAVNMCITPDGKFLFVCNVVSDTVVTLARSVDGSLSVVPGSSQSIGHDIRKCTTDGRYLFVTDESTLDPGSGVMVYAISDTGLLTLVPGSPFEAGVRPQDMVVFVPLCPPCPGDLDGDGFRNATDFTLFAAAYGSVEGDDDYNVCADLNSDGYVNVTDFTIFAGYYLVPCP